MLPNRRANLLTLSLLLVVGAHARQVIVTDVSPDFAFGATNQNMDGRIPGMVFDPGNNSIVYATGEWTGVWKSVDGAHTWKQSSSGLRNGITQQFAYPNLDVDSTNSQRLLYASTSKDGRGFTCEGCQFGGLWVSVNGAASWQHVNLCSVNQKADNVASVVFTSGRPFVATDCGIWSTTDPNLQAGWATLSLPNGISAGSTIFAPLSYGQTLFACLGGGSRVYRSLNLGQSWDGGVDVGGRCTGLAVAPIPNETQPSTSVTIRTTSGPVSKSGAGSNALEVTVVSHKNGATQNLGFANVATNGSGRSGVWTARHSNPLAGGTGPGVSYDVFAADNLNFYRYGGNNTWSASFGVHVDSWWMAFPNTYDAGAANCLAYAANDGGVFANATSSCSFNGWVAASSGLHVAWGNHISGLSSSSTDSNAKLCAASHGGQPCPLLFLPTTDDDTFIREAPTYSWTNFPDALGDSGEVLIDPAQSNLALACRNGSYNMFVAPVGQLPKAGMSFFATIAQGTDYSTGIQAPTAEGIKQVLTMPGEIVLTNGDFMAIQSPFSTDSNQCVENHNCGSDIIVRNVSAALGQQVAQSSWFDISPEAHFGPGQITGIYPSGGHSTTVYVLTSNASGVNYTGTPFKAGQVYKAHSQIIGEAITSWQPASGSGVTSLTQAYNLFVNPYNANELWAIDLGSSSAMKVSRDGGQSWNAVQQLKDIATNYGEFDFTCGAFANGPLNYQDKEIFGNQCSMTEMVFPPGQPQVRFAILYPGGVAFSGDSGNTWLPLNATNAGASQQPIELPQSAFYDPNVNASGNSSLYVALEGRGVTRIDAPFVTLGSGKQAPPTFQATSAQYIFVLGTDGNLWLEQAPFGKLPPPGRQQVDGKVESFQAIDADHILVIGTDGNLWLEQAPFGKVPPPGRQQVDGNAASVQSIDANHILVLGTNGNLWLEEPPFGKAPPPSRQQVDGNVGSFQAIDVNHFVVLGTDGNLWLEQTPFGKLPPPNRQQVDGNVESFQAVDVNHIAVLGKNGNLWLAQAPFGTVPPSRQQVDGNVRSFREIDANHIVVLARNGNLWLEQSPFGNVPPSREQVDGSVAAFQVIDVNHIVVLGTNGNLWLEQAPFGKVPPARQQIDANVRTPFAGS